MYITVKIVNNISGDIMIYFVILFVYFIYSLGKFNDIFSNYHENTYLFKEYTENDENVCNPEFDDLELKSNIVIIFSRIFFYLKMKVSDIYIVYITQ